MKKIIIVGAGGHAAEVVDYLNFINAMPSIDANQKWEVLGLIDDNIANFHLYSYDYPFLGDIKAHEVNHEVDYLIAVANIKFRRLIVESLLAKGAKFCTLIHPTAIVSPTAKIGLGNVISHNVSIGPKVEIGNFNLINSRCTLGHDTKLENYNFLSPQTVTGGGTEIGNNNFFGTNVAILPRTTVGNNNTISAGMVVDKSIHDDSTFFHRFKEKVLVISS
ncbi:acetyltransferase [Flavobacterium lacus]|uniref:Sugar O-acyltransferase (Sialic acid O-acetyltransferase NeuD family) n=1 Tax=Flavobacterium lacus TaxID=1353778 RepID=A0A328WLK3_9FLAO|nr:acetyltransferase [Flavobacterium lacus]RAR47222.1 sugar O-acyltransferase (sialic acid O-acetyltransferase NeuD family) [Flavobacterium lacus]